MGKGKGSHDRWIAPVVKGQNLYELNNKEKACNILSYFRAFRKA
jgi:ribosomal protein L16/L10AE